MEYRGLFGSNILPLGKQCSHSVLKTSIIYCIIAINVMSTFVHNEPTSLAIIQEAGLPDTFYRAIELGIEPAIEVCIIYHSRP